MPLLLAVVVALAVISGFHSHTKPTAAQLSLERGDFVAVVHALQGLESQLTAAAEATKAAWPHVANGPVVDPLEATRASGADAKRSGVQALVERASASAEAITTPAVFSEAETAALTGPASPIGGVFRTFIGLAPRGWRLIGAALSEIEDGPPAASAFARETVALYIESVYDGYFSLGQIGKKVAKGYKEMGGPKELGSRISAAEVNALSGFYSEASFRLHPHPGVKLGS